MGKEDPFLTQRILAFAQPPTVKGSIKKNLTTSTKRPIALIFVDIIGAKHYTKVIIFDNFPNALIHGSHSLSVLNSAAFRYSEELVTALSDYSL